MELRQDKGISIKVTGLGTIKAVTCYGMKHKKKRPEGRF